MEIHVHSSAEEALESAAQHLQFLLDTDTPVLFLSSGSSAFELLELIDQEVIDAHMTMGILNEQYTAIEADRNYVQLKEMPIVDAWQHRGVRMLNMGVKEGESIDAYALRVDTVLTQWIENNPDAEVIATMGIGTDGSTAGIFPYVDTTHEEALDELLHGKRWFVGYESESADTAQRATVTFTFLEQVVDEAIVYAAGTTKAEALERVVDSEEDTHELPASVLYAMNSVELFTDQEVD